MAQAPASFTVKFNLVTLPQIVLTDNSGWTSLEKPDVTGYFEITLPDGIKRAFNLATPDIDYNLTDLREFSYNLRLDSAGKPQCGTYIIRYVTDHPDYTPGEFTRTFEWTYKAVTPVLTEDFNVFSPSLFYRDVTVYARANYSITTQTWTWDATIGTVGSIVGATANFDLAYSGNYYDAEYDINFQTDVLYQHTTYSWLTVLQRLSDNILTEADTPCSPNLLIACLNDLKDRLDAAAANCGRYDALKAKYIYAESLLSHLFHKLKIDDTDGAVDLIEEFETVATCTCEPNRNQIIPPYDFTDYTGSGGSGWLVYNYFITAQNVTDNYFTISALIGKILKGIKSSGIGRKFVSQESTYSASEDSFWFKPSTARFTYNSEAMTEGTWMEIYYANS